MAAHLDHPFHFDGRGRTAVTGNDDHVRDLIYQVLFTRPGERVNRPDFGSGLLEQVFEPNSDALAAAVQATVQGALQQWLGGQFTRFVALLKLGLIEPDTAAAAVADIDFNPIHRPVF